MSLTTIVTCFEILLLERLPDSDSPMNLNLNLYNPYAVGIEYNNEILEYDMKRLSFVL